MAKYAGVDYIDFDSQLNDEERLVRQTAREFVENEIIPIIEKHSREATFPMHLVPQLGELGFFGASLHGYGCAGMSSVAYGLMTQELERGDSGIRSFVSVQSALVMYPIYAFGSEAQKDRLLRPYRAAVRLEPRRHAHARREKGPQIRPQRRKNVDHQRLHRRRCRGVGKVRRRQGARLPGGKRHARLQGLGRTRQVVAARFGHKRAGFERLRNSRGKSAAQRGRAERSAELFEPGALRDRLGRARRGYGLL